MIGIRGAVQARANEREEIHRRTREMLEEIVRRNSLEREDLVSAFFTMTPDLDADFPAHAARLLGWTGVPMLGAQETEVPGALERVIRVLVHAEAPGPASHVYLGAAAGMRPDLESGEPDAPGASPGGRAAPPPEASPADGTDRGSLLIVGLGLMGGSAALALRDRRLFREILGHDTDEEARELARRSGAVSEAFDDPAAAIARADVVMLALPIRELTRWLERWGEELRPGTVVLDLGSTKSAVISAMNELPPSVEAVGMHPMAGSERSGMRAARPGLYRGATWALVATSRTGERSREAATAVVRELGGSAVWMPAEEHDRAVAVTSHLPYLISSALARVAAGEGDAGISEGTDGTGEGKHRVGEAEDRPGAADLTRRLMGPGLRDMTRLAAADPAMMADILSTNWSRIRPEVSRFRAALERLVERVSAEMEDPGRVLREGVEARGRLFGQPPSSTAVER